MIPQDIYMENPTLYVTCVQNNYLYDFIKITYHKHDQMIRLEMQLHF